MKILVCGGSGFIGRALCRNLIAQNEDIAAFIPPFVDLSTHTDIDKYNVISTYAMKSMSAEDLKEIANISEGMENRISQSSFNNMDEFLGLTSKRYTRSTIKRIAASATVGLTKDLINLAAEQPPYCTALAFKPSKKKALLSLLAQSKGYFFFKHSDCEKDCPVRPLVDLDEKAAKILKICM